METFSISFKMDDNGLTTFFKHKIFYVPTAISNNWNLKKIYEQGLNINFKLSVDNGVIDKFYLNKELKVLLDEINTLDISLIMKNNKGARYTENKQNIKCIIPEILLGYLKKIFVSTIVFQAQKSTIPRYESIEFTFDTTNGGTVRITDLEVYVPIDNPFYEYAKNAVSSLSVEAIGLNQFSIEKDSKVKDFYNLIQTTKWKKESFLQKETGIEDKAGVYMLYDENADTFYVGKAIKLKNRILQHKINANGNDPIPNFTHYRYSVISGEYYEFLYLIENAAIHDCAWLLDMPKAQKFAPSLTKNNLDLNKCKMVNTAEHQTRIQD